MDKRGNHQEYQILILNIGFIRFENHLQQWMMVIQELILESEILRVENDNDGPQDELEYWKSRAAKLTLLVNQISSPECRMTLATLRAAQSRLLRVGFILELPFNKPFSRYGNNVNTKSSSFMWRQQTMLSSLGPLKSTVIPSTLR